ncbi:MAG TPA: bifunctional transaldolase/phosoglucose isomerase, partial [Vicinamibacterales bacterium]|nr:bifunctional transaldolase/phosoglucose isomerase [Vicinamibacterales bacterium]
NPLLALAREGQSVWIDYIRRALLDSGGLERLVRDDGLAGVTSNPTIFEKAIGGSADYDAQIRRVLAEEPAIDTHALFERLALDDIRAACDVLRPVFDRTAGLDGFVSFEVPPSVADDTEATTAHARRLWRAIERPNVMIKVPATPAGIPAIEALIADGINVNVTLMFSLDHYERVAHAYIRGAERCPEPARVASVASFFVSRVDTVVDEALERIGTPEALGLRGRAAVANSRLVYQRFGQLFGGEAFAQARARGARPQRPLWASTSTKNPAYRDVIYVEDLVAPDTVNTMPPATLEAFRDHGEVRGATAAAGAEAARRTLEDLGRLGVDLGRITEQLQRDGVLAFAKSYDGLMDTLKGKEVQLMVDRVCPLDLHPGAAADAIDRRLRAWQEEGLLRRIWARDHTVWSPTPVPELADRLGWLTLPQEMGTHAAELAAVAAEVKREGVEQVVLLGIGGSSLAPEVLHATFGRSQGYPELIVLDSTHPLAVRAVERRIGAGKTLFILASKSGTTAEPMALFHYFWRWAAPSARPGHWFVAITDPGTPLEALARERGFRRIFHGSPEVGGRYAALSLFGLVPAALTGIDVPALIQDARWMTDACLSALPETRNPALQLGAALGELGCAGRDKLTFLVEPPFTALPSWLEQLIAESTGKNGTGIVPVAAEPPRPVDQYGSDRVFVGITPGRHAGETDRRLSALGAAGHPVIRIGLDSPQNLGQEFFRWELAVAAAGAVLGVQPFDQPDVQLAKDMARRVMADPGAAGGASGRAVDLARAGEAIDAWLADARAGDYIALQAFLAPDERSTNALQALRRALGSRTGLATTMGYGPRFLHSTGQLHKGGPNTGLFLQIIDEVAEDLSVPTVGFTFGELIRAQAAGDAAALVERGRRVVRVQVGGDAGAGLERLAREVRRG